ncbi:MAG: chemotaxis response regulator protein-glutamate methylesterase [Verrucomicrobia bacterium]|nr:chemotaxis response regulator protein-glutamate methylesterase [Verrucomicrobiota bacterium]MBU4286325.1 chemotaxis response regulator protein-glutamate methylesterase [Verrucomicrobiota bacterium]MBU4365586.1 chemotaxis response regulator protein-glutamate methylesterase [Verrucomicrobiota bacterium]
MKIAIVNDLMMAVEALRRVVCSCPDYTIAWVARDGAEAVQKCAVDRPDMILMDLIMPVMNGAEATRHIMRDSPCPILVVTATVDGNISLVFEAMGYGALDAVNTPVLGTDGKLTGAQALLRKIEIIGHLISRPAPMSPAAMEFGALPTVKGRLPLIVLGASTGGPAALADILSRLPAVVNAAVVVIQHVDKEFAPDLALWLGTRCPLNVKVATLGCRPETGVVWLAGTNDHMVLTEHGTLEYQVEPVECFYRPSADVFFKSVAAHWSPPGVAVLLTGMGRDGGEGLLALRRCGWRTLAQDKATSIVYGMPRAGAELGAAEKILPLSAIADAIMQGIEKRIMNPIQDDHGKHKR